MTQEIVNRTQTAPAPQSRALSDLLGVYRSRMEQTPTGRFLISSDLAPSGADLLVMERRRADLMAAKTPANPKEIPPRIARMFLRFQTKPVDPAATAAAYAQDLAPFPLWAIDAGIMSILYGGAREFPPGSPTLRQAVVDKIAQVDVELAAINQVIGAEIAPPVDRRRSDQVQARISENLRSLRGNRPAMQSQGPVDHLKHAAEIAAQPMPPLSPELRKKFGLGQANPAGG